MKKGFTLIELLIVVAIIAILAAIAVPNFLEAQTRSKVARTKTDMRSVATALEAYAVDYSKYPTFHYSHYTSPWYDDATSDEFFVGGSTDSSKSPSDGANWDRNITTWVLTTPVAYITSMPNDVFHQVLSSDPVHTRTFMYTNWTYGVQVGIWDGSSAFVNNLIESSGPWRMFGAGPDKYRIIAPQNGVTINMNMAYDPTNGTVSLGNILRNQKSTEGKSSAAPS